VVLWSLGGIVTVVAHFVMWEAAALWLSIHHTQDIRTPVVDLDPAFNDTQQQHCTTPCLTKQFINLIINIY
jgi:hypothetical protein